MADYSDPTAETPMEAYRRKEQELYDFVRENLGFDYEVTAKFIDCVRAVIKATQ